MASGLQEILEQQTHALEQDPDNPKLRVEVAEVLESMERGDEAVIQYETASRLYVNLGQYPEAAATCRRVLNLAPAHQEARRIIEGLRRRGLADDDPLMAEEPLVADDPPISIEPASAPHIVLETGSAEDQAEGEQPPFLRVRRPTRAGTGPQQIVEWATPPKPVVTRELVSGQIQGIDSSDNVVPDLFSLLPPAVATGGIQQNYDPGETILREAEKADELFLLVDGEVTTSRGEGEDRIELESLTSGWFFNEIGALADGRSYTTVVASEPSSVLMIPNSQVKELVLGSPEANQLIRATYRRRLLSMVLQTSPLFAPLHERVARRFLRQFSPLKEDSGTKILEQGASAEGLFVILAGTVRVTVTDSDGNEVEVAELQHGDYFGEVSLLRSKACCATVTTSSFTQLVYLSPTDFHQFTDRHPRFKAAIDKEARRREQELASL